MLATVIAPNWNWLCSGDEVFPAMLAAIEGAQKSVCLETYTFSVGPLGERFREALIRAHKRGARVRVLIDALGSMTLPDNFWVPLRGVGAQVRQFNPLSLNRLGIRDHRKLLVCDETVAFVGGFNISSEYEGDGLTHGWYDLGLRVEGDLARELSSSFVTLFALADFQHRRFTRFTRSVNQKLVSTAGAQVVLAGPGLHPNLLKTVLLKDLRSARSVRIIAAYFLPARPIRRELIRAARRGHRVQIILGAKSDVPMLRLAFRRFYKAFLRAGIEIYEYQPQIVHAKLIIADGVVYAGSANLDRRSFLAN